MARDNVQIDLSDMSRPPVFSLNEWESVVAYLKLSPRQAQVVGYLMQSVSREGIQRRLGIKASALRTHFDRARARLRADDQMQLAIRVFEAFRELYYPLVSVKTATLKTRHGSSDA